MLSTHSRARPNTDGTLSNKCTMQRVSLAQSNREKALAISPRLYLFGNKKFVFSFNSLFPRLSAKKRNMQILSILRRYRTEHAREYRRTHPDRGGGQKINDCYWQMAQDHCSNTISTVTKDNMLCIEYD